MRLILCTGAGGAGVTTLAAATALFAARAGAVVRLAGTDEAALAGLLQSSAGYAEAAPPTLTLASAARLESGGLGDWLSRLLGWAGLEPALALPPWRLPGLQALAAMLALLDGSEGCDLAVADLGPISEALPVIHLLCADPLLGERPNALMRRGGAVVARLLDLPLPERAARDDGRAISARLDWLRSMLRDGATVSLRVALPEDGRHAGVERETRTVAGLHGISLDAFVTRGQNAEEESITLLAKPAAAPLCAKVSGESNTGPDRAGEDGSTRRLVAPWWGREPRGVAALSALGAALYGTVSPVVRLSPLLAPRFELTDGGADLVVPVPQRPPEGFAASRRDARLTVRVGEWQRIVPLPAEVAALSGRRAWHDGEVFRVRFA